MSTEQKMRELDRAGIQALFAACGEFHAKHSRGPGGAAICICGAACGGSEACRGLALLRNFFRYAKWGDESWREQFELLSESLG